MPARVLHYRFTEKQIRKLMELQWWNYGPDILSGIDLMDIEEVIRIVERRIIEGYPLYESESHKIFVKTGKIYVSKIKDKNISI